MTQPALDLPFGVRVRGAVEPGDERILTREALAFLAELHRSFNARRLALLQARKDAQARYDAGELPAFPAVTAQMRAADWQIAPLPEDLLDRRVEITGPVDRKMVINALNSGARMFMADFEDSSAPTWRNMVDGQINLSDAVRRSITYTAPNTGKHYELGNDPATLLVRPRGLHLPERHITIDGEDACGSLVDFGLFFFHNAAEQLSRGTGPYYYLPKLEHYLEARWWNDVFVAAQARLGIPQGSIKATVLIETLPASYQLDEILWELREHSAGLNCGRWDYIFSYIKTLRAHGDYLTPDRAVIGMTQPMMRAYTQNVVKVCHRRNAPAMGGMAAQIPIKNDPDANEAALNKVRADKKREVEDGHDGTWVAHPALVPLAMDIFTEAMNGKTHQLDRQRPDVSVTEAQLREVPTGPRTEDGARVNIRVGIQYLAAWLGGTGCVPLYNLMEDAATAEISRAQLWQWVKHGAQLDDGSTFTTELFRSLVEDEVATLKSTLGDALSVMPFDEAVALFDRLVTSPQLEAFLTLPAYDHIAAVQE